MDDIESARGPCRGILVELSVFFKFMALVMARLINVQIEQPDQFSPIWPEQESSIKSSFFIMVAFYNFDDKLMHPFWTNACAIYFDFSRHSLRSLTEIVR